MREAAPALVGVAERAIDRGCGAALALIVAENRHGRVAVIKRVYELGNVLGGSTSCGGKVVAFVGIAAAGSHANGIGGAGFELENT